MAAFSRRPPASGGAAGDGSQAVPVPREAIGWRYTLRPADREHIGKRPELTAGRVLLGHHGHRSLCSDGLGNSLVPPDCPEVVKLHADVA